MTAETQRVQHTPGPWHANTAADERYNDTVTIREPVNGDLVAVTSGKANARLIAAAPNLLAALEPFANLWDEAFADSSDDRPMFGFNDNVFTVGDLRAARAAIRKARGEDN